jgi:mycofactocin system creatininase family protein
MMFELGTATWPETAGDRRVLVVPVGSLEQHGPHLPLDTDTQVAVALTRGVSRLRDDIVVAPAVPYGASGEHDDFPGTVSVGRDALALYLLELVRSAAATYQRILFVNGHGGNGEPLGRITEQSHHEGRDARCWSPRVKGGDLHAGRVETSLLLALNPQTVRLDRVASGNTSSPEELYPRLRSEGVRAVSANGVLGDPRGASATEGRSLYATLLHDLDLFISRWPA